MNKIILLVLFVFCSDGCTLIGFYGGIQIDKSKHYSIENPTYDSLNIEIGTPISLYLRSDETINGRFSKVIFLTDSLSQNSALLNNEINNNLVCTINDSNLSNWSIILHTHDDNVEIPNDSIKTIRVKPYSISIIFTTLLGLTLDLLTFYAINQIDPGG